MNIIQQKLNFIIYVLLLLKTAMMCSGDGVSTICWGYVP